MRIKLKHGDGWGVWHVILEKLREATCTATVCKFWGGHFCVFGLVLSVAQLSSAPFYFL